MEKSCEVYRRNNNGPKTLPYCTPDTTLTNLLRQPSSRTCCDRFDRNCVNTLNIEPPIPRAELIENPPMVDPIKRCAEVNLHTPSLLPTQQCTLEYMGHHKRASQVSSPFRLANWVVGRTPLRSINRPRRTDTRRANTLDNTGVMEIGR